MFQFEQHLAESVVPVDVGKAYHPAFEQLLARGYSLHLVEELSRPNSAPAEGVELVKEPPELLPVRLLHAALLLHNIFQLIVSPRLRVHQKQFQKLFSGQSVWVLMR